MSSSLIKASYVKPIEKDNKRVIDSNKALQDRLTLLNEIMGGSSGSYGGDGFQEGLGAEVLGGLYEDRAEDAAYDDSYSSAPVASVDPETLLAEANARADEIINEANSQAEAIIMDANGQADGIRAKASEEGQREGYDQGYKDGMSQIEAMEAELLDRRNQLEAEYEELITQLEPRFVEKLTDIYSHVFSVDLSDQTELIFNLLRNTIRNIEGSKSFFVHVSMEDFDYVNEHKKELYEGLSSFYTIEVISDVSLNKSDCFIEADSGIFDCGLGTQLELLKKELRLLSYS